MLKISDAIKDMIHQNSFLTFGLSQRLVNLTQLATFIKPLIEVRTKKEVNVPAIVMNLSRLQRTMKASRQLKEQFFINNITVHSDLVVVALFKNADIHAKAQEFYAHVHKQNGYITITEGASEITLIFNEQFLTELQSKADGFLKNIRPHAAAIGVTFHEDYLKFPGMLYNLIQRITLQNINLIEVSSTYTEFIMYIDQDDTKLAFETLFACFGKKAAPFDLEYHKSVESTLSEWDSEADNAEYKNL